VPAFADDRPVIVFDGVFDVEIAHPLAGLIVR
jgi:hypothetical protein